MASLRNTEARSDRRVARRGPYSGQWDDRAAPAPNSPTLPARPTAARSADAKLTRDLILGIAGHIIKPTRMRGVIEADTVGTK